MFTDMVGYSALSQRNEALALELLEEHRRLLRPLFPARGGREIKTIGDAFLVEFASALEAATCAVEMQRALHTRNVAAAPDRRILVRIGLHAGDVVHKAGDVFGDGVNIAARIEPLAEAGGICVSEDIARQVQNKLAGCTLVKLGAGELKNIAVPVEIYRLSLPWQERRLALADRAAFLFAKKSVRRALVAAAAVLVLAGAFWLRRPAAANAAGAEKRLAVLPLRNVGGDAHDEYFAEGMTEELISSLSSLHELSVIARTSITKFKDTRLDVGEIGRALDVGSVLEGSVRLMGERARITVSLVDVATQKTLWTQEFNPTIKDVFAVQSAIAMSVTEALKVRLLAGEKSQLERRGAGDPEATRAYLLGRSELNQRTGPAVINAIGHFTQAVALDPSFALADAALAEAYTLAGNAGYGNLPRDEAIRHARDFATRALAKDDSLAEAHAAHAYVLFRIDWDWAGAEAGFRRALALKPGYARAHEQLGLLLAILRRFPEAMTEFQRARDLDPLSLTVRNGVGRALHFQRRYDEAIAQFQQALALDPKFPESHFNLGLTYLAMGRYDEAIATLETALQLSNNRTVIAAMLGVAQGFAGRKVEAQRIYDEMLAKSESPYYLAILSAGLGQNDRAFRYFDAAVAQRDGVMIYMAAEPVFAALAADPRFGVFLRKMGLSP
jgi:adenylate cyclase